MKPLYITLYIALSAVLLAGCFKDDTTADTVDLSAIHIDTLLLQKEYNIDKNATLTISPSITQSGRDLPLTYEWEIGYSRFSDAEVLEFTGEEIGSFSARLKVNNEHGSAFYRFTIHVNSPYEEGITVLSEDTDGTMMLSMMRKYSAGEIAAGKVEFFNTHCLTTNNPDITFARRPTDIAKRGTQLFISCLESPTVYVVNDKTLETENIITVPEYANFKPLRLMILDANSRSNPAICEDGTIYNLASLEQEVLPHTLLTSKYSRVVHGYAAAYQTYYYTWDNQKGLVGFYNGYSNWTGEQFNPPYQGNTPVAMFDNMKGETFTMITAREGIFYQTTLGIYGSLYDANYNIVGVDIREHFAIGGAPTIDAATPFASSPTYRSIYYAIGNKIYRKYFSDPDFPSTPWATIDLSGAEITSLTVSPDESQLYVGVYQAGSGGLNGHIYLFNSQSGAAVSGSPYKQVAYKPVKIFYKKK